MPKWKELRYGTLKLDLGISFLSVTVNWDSSVSRGKNTGYRFYVNNSKSKKYYRDVNEAKTVAVEYIKRQLEIALEHLE
jgi:hypothetical protein